MSSSDLSIDWRWFASVFYRLGVTLMLAFLVWTQIAPYNQNPAWWSAEMGRAAILGVMLMAIGAITSLWLWAYHAGAEFRRWRTNDE